jgi:hypothetical protein
MEAGGMVMGLRLNWVCKNISPISYQLCSRGWWRRRRMMIIGIVGPSSSVTEYRPHG